MHYLGRKYCAYNGQQNLNWTKVKKAKPAFEEAVEKTLKSNIHSLRGNKNKFG